MINPFPRAEELYNDFINHHPTIHTNRFPAWSELRDEDKWEWIGKALEEWDASKTNSHE